MRRQVGSGSQGDSDEIDADDPEEGGSAGGISDELDERLAEAWEQLDSGDIEGARTRGEQLAKEVPDAPEAPFLLAACASEAGEDDQALTLLDRAVALDPGWAEPELRAAELLADRGDIAGALVRVTAAQRKAEEDESEQELLDSLALRAGLELELDKPALARRTLSALPSPQAVQASGELLRELAHLQLAVDNFNGAEAWFKQAIAADGQDADAWHGLGLAAEAAGDEEGKREAWLKTLALDDRDDPDFQEHLTEAQMAEVAEAALAELPARARRLLADVPILIADRPARKDVETGLDPRLLGLFAGSAYPELSGLGATPQLTQILLFRRNLERVAQDEEELREEIRTTLLHETGHFFGMTEQDLHDVGLG
jgi:predicted Zn-dependent protease with MMP-like domain/Flp pilus assembly protein TadD